MDDKVLAYCMSLEHQMIEVWLKLGGKYGEWTSANLFSILRSKLRISDGRDFASWDDVTHSERMAAIGIMRAMLAAYRAKWDAVHSSEAQARDHSRSVLDSCMTLEQAKEYLYQHHFDRILPEIFDYADTIQGVKYLRLRDHHLKLFTLDRAQSEWSVKYWLTDHVFPSPLFREFKCDWYHGKVYELCAQS